MQFDLPRCRNRLISLTPLIDVVFILLLFFMLSTQFYRLQATSMQVNPPTVSDAVTDIDMLVLKLLPGGGMQIDGNNILEVESEAFSAVLRVANNHNRRLLLRSDDKVSLQELMNFLDTVSSSGFDQRQLVIDF